MIEKIAVSNFLLGKTLNKVREEFMMPFLKKMDEEDVQRNWITNLMNTFEDVRHENKNVLGDDLYESL